VHTDAYPLMCIHVYYFSLPHNKIFIKAISISHHNQNYLGILTSFFSNCKVFSFKIGQGHYFRPLLFKITSLLVYFQIIYFKILLKFSLPKNFSVYLYTKSGHLAAFGDFVSVSTKKTAMDRVMARHWCNRMLSTSYNGRHMFYDIACTVNVSMPLLRST